MSSSRLPIQNPNSSWAYSIPVDTGASKILNNYNIIDAGMFLTNFLCAKYTSYKNDRLLIDMFWGPALPVYMNLSGIKKENKPTTNLSCIPVF